MKRLTTLKPTLRVLPTHAPKQSGWGAEHRGTADERGYGAEWRKRRKRILARDLYCCVQCKREGRVTPATDVDHIVPRAQGGTEDDSNLQSLCGPCHDAKTRAENGRVWR